MRLPASLMGCLSSRSTIVPVPERTADINNTPTGVAQINNSSGLSKSNGASAGRLDMAGNTSNSVGESRSTMSRDRKRRDTLHKRRSMDSIRQQANFADEEEEDDEMISILIDEQNEHSPTLQGHRKRNSPMNESNSTITTATMAGGQSRARAIGSASLRQMGDSLRTDTDETSDTNRHSKDGESSVQDEATNIELLRQYITVDYEISLLEDKDALRVYHEKIEQLEQFEQFERELDMISSEADEVATRSDSNGLLEELLSKDYGSLAAIGDSKSAKDLKDSTPKEAESNSMLSSMLPLKSWLGKNQPPHQVATPSKTSQKSDETLSSTASKNYPDSKGTKDGQQLVTPVGGNKRQVSRGQKGNRTTQYTSVEEVFNRKIVLEKQRDKLKKEVEMAIIECDKLQQRYKKRDEILDKLFEGRTGNGLENHLEQQLNWLLEQKHYVDQVYYVWKRAETLTNQTCEQFANALELIKKLPDVEDAVERAELVKNIGNLMIKSRQGMEQAQKYNPNVDAPFFTDNETERFDKIIERISTNSLNQSEYSQILTVVQFAYKRAVSIRLWLEQILQTTIARDSFELAEEYKWIAIQLRKERINLIKAKLESPSYRQMVQEVREQMARQFFNGAADISKQIHEVNRDSGVGTETKDVDLEEEVYRLLEMNKFRFLNNAANSATGEVPLSGSKQLAGFSSTSGGNESHHSTQSRYMSNQSEVFEEKALDNLLKVNSYPQPETPLRRHHQATDDRMEAPVGEPVNGSLYPHTSTGGGYGYFSPEAPSDPSNPRAARLITETPIFDTSASRPLETPTKLRIELDEKAKQSLLQTTRVGADYMKQFDGLAVKGDQEDLEASGVKEAPKSLGGAN